MSFFGLPERHPRYVSHARKTGQYVGNSGGLYVILYEEDGTITLVIIEAPALLYLILRKAKMRPM